MKRIFEKFLREAKASTKKHDPYRSFRYKVSILAPGTLIETGFQKVSGLKMDVDVVEYREGGDNITVSKSPGLAKFDPITLEKGMTTTTELWDLAQDMFHVDELAHSKAGFRVSVIIELYDRDNTLAKKWEIPHAWISKYETGDFDAMTSATMIETMELQHEGFKLV